MKYKLLLLISTLILPCCTSMDCFTDDPIVNSLFIKLIDTDGNNLIENSTFKSEDITVSFNDSEFTGVVFNNVAGLENLIIINIAGIEEQITYEIKLSNSRTDTLSLTLMDQAKNDPCGFASFIALTAIYNRVDQVIEEFKDDQMITVVL